jgi:isopenicillin N synthase-like dioxygenase
MGGCFVVIFGDAFEVLTNGRVPSTVHRVRCPPSLGGPRTSVVLFAALDDLLEPPAAFGMRRRTRKQLEEWWARAEAVSGALI